MKEPIGKIAVDPFRVEARGWLSLKGKRRGQYSIRVNDQFRVCFRWMNEGPADVEIVDYH